VNEQDRQNGLTMILVTLELHSAITGKVTELGRAIIANDESSTDRAIGNYTVKLSANLGGVPREGRVVGHCRSTWDFWPLIAKALAAAIR
jgi:hypothetical protein